MVRPKKENPMTSTERSQKRRSNPEKCAKANEKKREARRSKNLTNPLSEEELKEKRQADRLRKAASRTNKSRQKKVGERIKDRNRKRKQAADETEEVSTKRVQKHCAVKVKIDFSSKIRKVDCVAKALDTSLFMLSPQSKVKAITKATANSLSPGSRSIVAENIDKGTSNPLVDFHKCSKQTWQDDELCMSFGVEFYDC